MIQWLLAMKVKRAQLRAMSKTVLWHIGKELSSEIKTRYGIIYSIDFKQNKEKIIDDIFKMLNEAIENKFEYIIRR